MLRYRLIRDDGIVKIFEKNEFYEIYEYICEKIFNEDVRTCDSQIHQEAQGAQSWCELASIGEVYDGNGFEIEVISN